MAFKMKRPLKMKAPLKRAGLNIGKTTDESGLYYNSSMGPMKMHSPSALKQIEEGMGEGGGMEEMMGMMGGEAGGGPVEEAPVEKESEEKVEHVQGQEMTIKEDGTIVIDSEYGIAGIPDNAVVEDPDGILEFTEDGGDKFVMDEDYTFEVQEGKVIITGIRELAPGE